LTTLIDDDRRTPPLAYPATAPSRRSPGTALKRALFGISPGETSFVRRGFHAGGGAGDAAVRERLESVGRCFVAGYHAALEESGETAVAARIDVEVEREFQGFAYEGAGMALALLDALTPPLMGRHDRLARFLAGPGDPHAYIVNVGAGWILARLPLAPERLLARLDPLLGWLALDGYGFHEGFFHAPRTVARQEVPGKLRGYARRGFDQGLGRSLWFVEGADVERIPRTVGAFPAGRQPDLWAGVGLAAAYAGGRSRAEIEALRRAAGPCLPQLAQGAAFAVKARQRAGNLAAHTELAAQVICGTGAERAAEVPDQALEGLPADRPGEPAFEVWRRRIQDHFRKGV
jgi:enediyne biosynthesis protein E3